MTERLSENQIKAARQVTLLDYLLRHEPDLVVRVGNAYRTPKGHSSLTISADGTKWHWFAGQVGGRSALDYLVKVEKLPFREAVERIHADAGLPPLNRPPPVEQPATSFVLPKAASSPDRVIRYLTGRGIPEDMVQQCIRQGTLYESTPHHNCVFVGRDSEGTPRFASLRGTLPGKPFRMDQPGSEKRYGFRYIPPGCMERRWVAVCESPIDALSYAALNRSCQINSVPWTKLPVISLSGTAPAAILQYLRDSPDTDVVYLALDNDEAGQQGVQRIAKAIEDDARLSAQVKRIISALPSPAYGKDYNEMLQTLQRENTICRTGTKRPEQLR